MKTVFVLTLTPLMLLAGVATGETDNLNTASELVVEKTNAFRKEHNLSALEISDDLHQSAKSFAEFMAKNEKYGHNADGRTPAERAEAAGYDYCVVRENIAYRADPGEPDATKLAEFFTQGWIESPGHRENMLADFTTQTGVAIATTDGTTFYAVQLFGRPESQSYRFTLTNETDETWTVAIESDGASDEMDVPPRGSLRSKRCLPILLKIPDTDAKTKIKTTAELTIVMQDGSPVFEFQK